MNKHKTVLAPKRILISATFTATPILSGLLFWNKELSLDIEVEILGYNQVFQELLNPMSAFKVNKNGMNVILLRFEDWLPFKDDKPEFLSNTQDSEEFQRIQGILRDTLSDFVRALKTYYLQAPCQTLLLICPSSEVYEKQDIWQTHFTQLSDVLKEQTRDMELLQVMFSHQFHANYHIDTIEDALRNKIGHIPYVDSYYHFLSTLLVRFYYSLNSSTYKVIVVDCDNTLWKGVCGETGPSGIDIDGTYRQFQSFLVQQKEMGVLLCICSKNVEEDVRKVFDNRTDFPLKWGDITDHRINWEPKSENLYSLAESLNLGIDSFIFIDDNPVECAEVRANCPMVLTLQWPETEIKRIELMNHVWAFDHYHMTSEDAARTEMTKQNLERNLLLKESMDFSEFIEKLDLEVDIQPMEENHLARVSQMTNRTNQFNFSTFRRNQNKIKNLLRDEGYECLVVHVRDRFGEYGLVGTMIMKECERELLVDSFMLSCRVLGRGVEHKMITELGKLAVERDLKRVRIIFIETEKNIPARNFLKSIAEQIPGATTHATDEDKETCIIDSESLKTICFIPESPAKLPASSSRKKKKSQSIKNRIHSNKVEQIVRIAETLTNTKQITLAIESSVVLNSPAHIGMTNKTQKKNARHTTTLDEVQQIFTKILSLEPDQLDSRESLEKYVNDSLKIVELTAELQKRYPELPSTFLFEHSSIDEIASAINGELLPKSSTDAPEKCENSLNTPPDKGESKLQAESPSFDVAIVGVNGRFPKAETVQQFWANLLSGMTCTSEIPKDRWNVEQYFEPSGAADKMHNIWGGFLKDVDCFDHSFFNIPPVEAELMDPQQRIFLEVVWGMLEDACYTRQSLTSDTGVFVGVISNDYSIYASEAALSGVSSYRAAELYQIPNRVSYYLNLHGPSIAIDSACSASGTAVHLAYESLKRGECKAAIVGGVNLFLHPARFIQYSQMNILSKDKQCSPFGADASGTVFGEGICALLLKPLNQAIQDNDNIYAVIKGTAINSGGKTNGFTVPNPNAQAELISTVIKKASIPACTISYVETHGTGTPLGDPIEVRGLMNAFEDSYSTLSPQTHTQYCALGSVKSNIGHLESGAAVAGIIKTIYQMKHKTIVPSLHSSILNPLIPFESSPFYIPQQVQSWERPVLMDEDGTEVVVPRRAGLNSFGAGGSNAHILLEEYEDSNEDKSNCVCIPIIVLSAKNEETLNLLAMNLRNFVETCKEQKDLLGRIAYNLQTGREEFKFRLAIICDSMQDLQEKLGDYLNRKTRQGEIFTGEVKANPVQQLGLGNTELEKSFIYSLSKSKEYQKLAALWIIGMDLQWEYLYKDGVHRRMSLPTYPFKKVSHWLPNLKNKTGADSFLLHPLLHQNISNFSEQRFRSTFTGREFFFADHVVKGHRVLPSVAYLEIAHAAVVQSVHGLISEPFELRFLDIVWPRPLSIDARPVSVVINLWPEDDDSILYEICSDPKTNSDELIVHSQGRAIVVPPSEHETLDIDLLKHSCNKMTLRSEHCYETFTSMGLDYGLGLQGLQELFVGAEQALAKLSLHEETFNQVDQYILHPGIMDSALQAAIGLMVHSENILTECSLLPHFPLLFELHELHVIGGCTPCMWAFIRTVGGSITDKRVCMMDIDLCDEYGNVRVKMRGCSYRVQGR